MCNKQKESSAKPNDYWISKMKGRFKFNFGAMEASMVLYLNHQKTRSLYSSSKWNNKNHTTLHRNVYPNTEMVAEEVIATGIALIIILNKILEKETSLPISPSTSNQRLHDDHCAISLDNLMVSHQPRAPLRKEVRRPRTRHKADRHRLLN